MDVALVRWPEEAARRELLRGRSLARLLLVDEGVEPPDVVDGLEDWIRIPADDRDVRARMATLALRAASRQPEVPELDADGVLRLGSAWTSLPPVEARLTEALLEKMGAVVGRDALTRAGWPDGSPGRNALDVHVLRLRRRLAPVGLAIRTVRSRGYLLEPLHAHAQDAADG